MPLSTDIFSFNGPFEKWWGCGGYYFSWTAVLALLCRITMTSRRYAERVHGCLTSARVIWLYACVWVRRLHHGTSIMILLAYFQLAWDSFFAICLSRIFSFLLEISFFLWFFPLSFLDACLQSVLGSEYTKTTLTIMFKRKYSYSWVSPRGE